MNGFYKELRPLYDREVYDFHGGEKEEASDIDAKVYIVKGTSKACRVVVQSQLDIVTLDTGNFNES